MWSNRVIAVTTAISLFLGFTIGSHSVKLATGPDTPDSLTPAQRSLRELSETEYQEYLRLKDSPEKAKRAEELLGKVMQLILADIAIVSGMTRPLTTGESLPVPIASDSTVEHPRQLQPKEAPTLRKWIEIEQRVTNGKSEAEVLDALRSVDIPDLFHELQVGQSLSNDQLRQVSGRFSGEVTFYDGSEPWRVEWFVDADAKDDGLVGKQVVTLSKQGKIFSRTNNDGSLKDFSAASGNSKAIFVKANGDAGYMQLWAVTSLQRLAGVYFAKTGIDRFRPIGTVNLERVQ